ncbi:hypothetical protein KFK14_13035 [Sphingobium phenoxybenzoativorans]|uniref:Uncharacterized protein n=1 Tax=Sphingobium phenoxybenzoativorans TaxID=1592790 RepID=A0A975K394_9SPHN|nr:hypothetical protein [Sphingobium phenoxybenzoativorans]QUT04071.1 hypothetical protein KFK14_13035 [Sphingobium phenoxybenzoativorans]
MSNLSAAELADALQKSVSDAGSIAAIREILGITGDGGGTPTPTQTAPEMPLTASFIVPEARPNGSIIAYVPPSVVGFPAPQFAVTSIPGATVDSATGDLIVQDRTSLFAALDASPLTYTLTASNIEGQSQTAVSLTKGGDYRDLEEFNAYSGYDWDILDNRQMLIDASTNDIYAIKDKSPYARHATNFTPRKKMNYVLNGLAGAGKPGARINAVNGSITGDFFPEAPIWHGLRSFDFVQTTSTYDRVRLHFDGVHNVTSYDNTLDILTIDFPPGSFVGKTTLVGLTWTTTTVSGYINGQLVIENAAIRPFCRPKKPGMFFALVSMNTFQGSIVFTSAIGQHTWWDLTSLNGDVHRIIQYPHAVEAV